MINSQLNTLALSAESVVERTLLPIQLQAAKVGMQVFATKHLKTKNPYVDLLKPKGNDAAMLPALLAAIGLHMFLLTMVMPTAEQIEMPVPSTPMMVSIIKPQVEKAVSSIKPVHKKVKRQIPKQRPKPIVQKRVEAPSKILEKPQTEPVDHIQEPVQLPPVVQPTIEETANQKIDMATAPVASAPEKINEEDVIEAPKFGVAYLHNPAPNYPRLSHRAGEEGQVVLKVLVSASGQAETVVVEKSSQFARLDQAAMAAVKQWRFVPAKKGNQTTSAYVLVPISFSLSD